jgi:hypothetical protein
MQELAITKANSVAQSLAKTGDDDHFEVGSGDPNSNHVMLNVPSTKFFA